VQTQIDYETCFVYYIYIILDENVARDEDRDDDIDGSSFYKLDPHQIRDKKIPEFKHRIQSELNVSIKVSSALYHWRPAIEMVVYMKNMTK